MQLIIY